MTVRTRFAPSPTGYLHVGGARTALFSWLYAKQNGGQFILRIEDTDLERSTQESVDAIFEGMAWLGLDHDEGPFYQTQHLDRYNQVIDQLLDQGHAYRCSCSRERLDALREQQMASRQKPRYDGHCRHTHVGPDQPHVIRFKNPESGHVEINDQIRGRILVQNSELDDLIIRRTDGSPTYNLTVVVDDHDMGITEVIRGDDHINNTPRQINLLRAMGWSLPEYAHVPMILGDDGTRLSKRHGAVGVMQYQRDGYLPEALLNYLVRLGWSHGDQELFSINEMIEFFELSAVNKAPSIFSTDKLRWINQQYIKTADLDRLTRLVEPFLTAIGVDYQQGADLRDVVVAQRERAMTLIELAEVCAFYFRDFDAFDEKAAKKAFKGDAARMLEAVSASLSAIHDWDRVAIHTAVKQTVASQDVGFGKIAMPLRIAVTGGAPSPDLDLTLQLVGRDATHRRIQAAIAHINQGHEAQS